MKFKEIFEKGIKDSNRGHLFHTLYIIITLPFTWFFLKLKIKPNYISIMGMILRTLGLYFYFIFFEIPAVLLWVTGGYILDYCDGFVARLTNQCSTLGKWLDCMSDAIWRRIFFGVLPIAFFMRYKDFKILLVAVVLFTVVNVREKLCASAFAQRKEKYSCKREEIKSRYSIPSRIFVEIIDFNFFAFPFIIFFGVNIFIGFYIFNILIETLRIIFYVYASFLSLRG